MGFLSVPNLVPWLIFVAWIITDQSRMNHIALQLDREGIKGREDDERSSGEAIILNFSVQGGVIIQHTQLIEGQLLFEETNQPTFK